MQLNHGGFGGRRHKFGYNDTKAFIAVEEMGGGSSEGRSDENKSVMVKVTWVLVAVGMVVGFSPWRWVEMEME